MKTLRPLTLSFEFFPPKSEESMTDLKNCAEAFSHLHPNFFSVTFGAGGSTRKGTVETVNMLRKYTQIDVAPHLACIGTKKSEAIEMIHLYHSLGINRIVALRGDLPSGLGQGGEFNYAHELVALIRQETGDYFHVEVAAYPEIHPQATSAFDDILNLKRKYDAGANGAITQYFFNPDAYFYFLDECAKQAIFMPIIPGIMPILHYNNLARFSKVCGAEIPRWIVKRLETYSELDMESQRAFGFEVVYNLCQHLINGGAPGLHFYTLNKAELCIDLLNTLINNNVEHFQQQTNIISKRKISGI